MEEGALVFPNLAVRLVLKQRVLIVAERVLALKLTLAAAAVGGRARSGGRAARGLHGLQRPGLRT